VSAWHHKHALSHPSLSFTLFLWNLGVLQNMGSVGCQAVESDPAFRNELCYQRPDKQKWLDCYFEVELGGSRRVSECTCVNKCAFSLFSMCVCKQFKALHGEQTNTLLLSLSHSLFLFLFLALSVSLVLWLDQRVKCETLGRSVCCVLPVWSSFFLSFFLFVGHYILWIVKKTVHANIFTENTFLKMSKATYRQWFAHK